MVVGNARSYPGNRIPGDYLVIIRASTEILKKVKMQAGGENSQTVHLGQATLVAPMMSLGHSANSFERQRRPVCGWQRDAVPERSDSWRLPRRRSSGPRAASASPKTQPGSPHPPPATSPPDLPGTNWKPNEIVDHDAFCRGVCLFYDRCPKPPLFNSTRVWTWCRLRRVCRVPVMTLREGWVP